MSKRPEDQSLGVLCHVCGTRLTCATLLPGHLAKCGGRPIAPMPHDRDSIVRWNNKARAAFELSLPTCDCGKRFASKNALEKHAKRCELWRIHKGAFKATLARATSEAPAICHMCGQGVVLDALKDHTNACVSRWFLTAPNVDGDNELLSRMPPALKPPGSYDDPRAARVALRAYNRLAADVHVELCRREMYYAQCAVCSKRFSDPKQCFRHEKSCRVEDRDFKVRVDPENSRTFGREHGQNDLPRETTALCPICGQYEFTRSLLKHLDQCRAKWEVRQRPKPVHRRRPAPAWPEVPLPQEPGRDLTRWNDAVRTQRAVYECPKCLVVFERSRPRFSHVKRCCPEIALTLSPDSDDDTDDSTTRSIQPVDKDDRTIVCFICGRRYGTASIGKHTAACETRWVRENNALPAAARRNLIFPDAGHWPPPSSEPWLLAEYNEIALQLYHDTGRLVCPKCDRTFGEVDERSKHIATCCPEVLQVTLHASEDDEEEDQHTQAITTTHDGGGGCVCYICGRSVFSVSTIAQHVKKCRTHFLATASLEPPHRRPKLPTPPGDVDLPNQDAGHSKLVAWNRAARQVFLAHCPTCPGGRCGRSFPDARKLQQHMAGCCPTMLETARDAERNAELLLPDVDPSKQLGIFCHICGRTVLSSLSLPFHFSSCLRRFYAFEDEMPASEQRRPTVPPCIASWNIGDAGSFDAEDDEELESSETYEDDFAEQDNYSDDEDHLSGDSEKRNVVLMCYTCGSTRETPDSISNHVLECRKRWQNRERLRPRAWRRPLPQNHYCTLPGPGASGDMLDAWNKSAAESHGNTIVCRCENCGRTFSGHDRLAVHQKACEREPKCDCGMRFEKGPKGELALRSHATSCQLAVHAVTTEQKAHDAEPLHGVCCYLCGRRCLVSSLRLHIASCKGRWKLDAEASKRLASNESLEAEDAVVPPDPPSLPVPNDESGVEERRAYSEEAESIWRAHCPTCTFCSRVFDRTEKLRKHQSSGCPNLEWQIVVRLSEKVTASALLRFLSSNEAAADMLDQVFRARIATMTPSKDVRRVRIESVALEKRGLTLIGGVYGFRCSREATLAACDDAWPKAESEEAAPVLPLDGLPEMFFHGEVRLVGLKVRSGVSALVGSFPETLISALEKVKFRTSGDGIPSKTVYEEPTPFCGRVRSCVSAYRRRVDADARDKRNQEMSLRLKNVKSVVSTRGSDPSRPQHCHATVQRKRSSRERDLHNEKIGRALRDIYSYPKSRLEKHGVKAVDCNKMFAHRTALYSTSKMHPRTTPTKESRAISTKENAIHDVSKGLGVAKCAACGIVAYSGSSDTTPMRPCPLCKETYYCDDTCCAVDAPAHAVQCSHATGRRKQWPTRMVRYWIESRSTIVARKALRRRPKPSIEQVLREIAATRASERPAPSEVDRTAVTKHRIRDQRSVPKRGSDTNKSSLATTDDERGAATARLEKDHRLGLESFRLERSESKRLRDERRDAEKKIDVEISRKAETGMLEERIAELDARALSLAIERRDAMRQLAAVHTRDDVAPRKPHDDAC